MVAKAVDNIKVTEISSLFSCHFDSGVRGCERHFVLKTSATEK
uniref:Uncharacterized protein n=1 Tax=Ascaris lumbricoides TaxID=6252 RepID=A0A0M3I2C0_ASCLU